MTYSISTEAYSQPGVMPMAKYEYWITEDGLKRIEAYARDGLTNEQIAGNMGITKETLNQWRKKFPSVSDSLKRGKEVVDIEVENALLKRALGYTYEEKTYEYGVETKRIVKQVAPDVGAQCFWLKNRRPDKWRDRQNWDLTVEEQKARISQINAQTDKIKQETGGGDDDDGVDIINDAPKETG